MALPGAVRVLEVQELCRRAEVHPENRVDDHDRLLERKGHGEIECRASRAGDGHPVDEHGAHPVKTEAVPHDVELRPTACAPFAEQMHPVRPGAELRNTEKGGCRLM
ncbi:hypothetical protein [uncultured Amnibacterium sp.]|uniref:hypothetical protein n=1 Tax=uncultured Amnibacterium sp. TaxID=1631851 RepID=UPI0035CA7A33